MKKYLDVDKFCSRMKTAADGCTDSDCRDCAVHKAEKVEVPEIVRCGDCKWFCAFVDFENVGFCDKIGRRMQKENFCSYGERRSE